jgi:mannose-1-phosphate guanylyltransferase
VQFTSSDNVVVLIMAGGKGSRLWPISSNAKPKQFCYLTSKDHTMLQSIFKLAKDLVSENRIYVSTCGEYSDWVSEQLFPFNPANIIQEPAQHGTTAAIAFAMAKIKIHQPDCAVVVVSSDCVIEGNEQFLLSIQSAVTAARSGNYLVSVGVTPTHAHTGYGYMQCGKPTTTDCFQGVAYIEKPNKQKALRLLKDGGYLWNTGIFVWQIDVIRKALAKYTPHSENSLKKLEAALEAPVPDDAEISALYLGLENSAIDYAIMEKLSIGSEIENAFVRGDFFWSDIGSYRSWKDILETDNDGNATTGDVRFDSPGNAENCILVCETPYRIKVGTVDNTIVSVCREGNVLVIPVDEDQNIKKHLGRDGYSNGVKHNTLTCNTFPAGTIDVQIVDNEVRINC